MPLMGSQLSYLQVQYSHPGGANTRSSQVQDKPNYFSVFQLSFAVSNDFHLAPYR